MIYHIVRSDILTELTMNTAVVCSIKQMFTDVSEESISSLSSSLKESVRHRYEIQWKVYSSHVNWSHYVPPKRH
jgi:hypothetical protein